MQTVRGLWTYRGKVLKQYKEHRYLVVAAPNAVAAKVHHLVLEAFVGPRPDGAVGCHGKKGVLVNEIGNLRWDSVSENNRDITRHGKRMLNFDTAEEIRRRYKARCRVNGARAIAVEYGVTAHIVEAILFKKDSYRAP